MYMPLAIVKLCSHLAAAYCPDCGVVIFADSELEATSIGAAHRCNVVPDWDDWRPRLDDSRADEFSLFS